MEIIHTKRYGSHEEEQQSIQTIVHLSVDEENLGAVERVRAVANKSIDLTANLMSVLHKKGILSDGDIKSILEDTGVDFDADEQFKVTHE